jgi:hypothetical protein
MRPETRNKGIGVDLSCRKKIFANCYLNPQAAHFFRRLSDRQSRAYDMPFPASLTEKKDSVGSDKFSNKK